jgi:hypothetical protein
VTTYEAAWPGQGSPRHALLERIVALSPAGIDAVAKVVRVFEEAEARASTSARLSRLWKELAKRARGRGRVAA